MACQKEMYSKGRRGQIFIVLLIILVVVIVLFVALPMFEARRKSPLVQQVFWKANGKSVTSSFVGEEVEAHVTIEASEEYVGSVVVKIRKDLNFWFDSDYTVKSFPVDLVGGRPTELVATFSPDQTSGGQLRGYFVEVDFPVTNSNWIMQSSYPPRLTVTAITPGSNLPA